MLLFWLLALGTPKVRKLNLHYLFSILIIFSQILFLNIFISVSFCLLFSSLFSGSLCFFQCPFSFVLFLSRLHFWMTFFFSSTPYLNFASSCIIFSYDLVLSSLHSFIFALLLYFIETIALLRFLKSMMFGHNFHQLFGNLSLGRSLCPLINFSEYFSLSIFVLMLC